MMNVSVTAAAEFLAMRPKHAEDSPWLMATLVMVVGTVYIYRQAQALEERQHAMHAAAVATLEHEKRHAPAAGACTWRDAWSVPGRYAGVFRAAAGAPRGAPGGLIKQIGKRCHL